MDDRLSGLPWDELWRAEGEIPWSAMEAFADAVATEPDLTEELFNVYEQARGIWLAKVCYADLYVPAIFALAAPKLDEDRRRRIGEFLVKKLAEAGKDDDDLMMEVMVTASGSMGPVTVPAVLAAIAAEPDSHGAWFHLWGLTALAAVTEETAVRDLTVQACVRLLDRADRGEVEAHIGIEAAHTLGLLGRTEYTELLKRLSEKCGPLFGCADFEAAVELLNGSADRYEWPETWDEPVHEWFEPRWRMARDWFAKRSAEELEDVSADSTQPRNVIRRFLRSAWATDLPDDLFEDAPFITSRLLEYAGTYEGTAPNELNEPTLRNVLLDVFPRKVTGERSFFAKVAPVVEAFLEWMASEGILENASALARTVHGWAEEIVAAATDPGNWGPAKAMTMKAQRAGVDTTDADALQSFWYEQALQSLEQSAPDQVDGLPLTPTAPIVEHAPKIGRNDPCPCGSGKKYKRCCGSPTKDQAAHHT